MAYHIQLQCCENVGEIERQIHSNFLILAENPFWPRALASVLAVEEEEVDERLRRERRVLKQIVQLPEALRGVRIHVHQRLSHSGEACFQEL